MYFQITKLIYLLPLPEDIVFHILHLVGVIRLRNGKYSTQINRNFPIFKQLRMLPSFVGKSQIQLYIKTQWFRKSFCDKIITLRSINYNNELTREYDCSWYEYDEANAQHHIKTEENYITYYGNNNSIEILIEDEW
jgi:hypothetical protein